MLLLLLNLVVVKPCRVEGLIEDRCSTLVNESLYYYMFLFVLYRYSL